MIEEPERAEASAIKVSVVIPAYGRADSLPAAIRSVLGQTHRRLELILVDDASPEPLRKVADQFNDDRLRVLRRDVNGGAAAARNSGIDQATGDLVAFLDSDDEWAPEKLEKQISVLAPEGRRIQSYAGAVSGFSIRYLDGSRIVREEDRVPVGISDLDRLCFGCDASPGSTLVVWRDVFDDIGVFDEEFPRFEDWDWLVRAVGHHEFPSVDALLAAINVGGRAGYDVVKASCRKMKDRHRSRFRASSVLAAMKFDSGLSAEQAVAARVSGKSAHMVFHGLLCLLFWPPMGWQAFRRAPGFFRTLR